MIDESVVAWLVYTELEDSAVAKKIRASSPTFIGIGCSAYFSMTPFTTKSGRSSIIRLLSPDTCVWRTADSGRATGFFPTELLSLVVVPQPVIILFPVLVAVYVAKAPSVLLLIPAASASLIPIVVLVVKAGL
jgi:hypothetical protein